MPPPQPLTAKTLAALTLAFVLANACAKSQPPEPAAGTTATTGPSAAAVGQTGPTQTQGGKQAFLEAANSICKQTNSDSAALTESYGPHGPQTAEEVGAMLDANAGLIEQSVADMRKLPQPAGDEAALTSLYDQVEKLAAQSRLLGTAIRQGDKQAATRLQSDGDKLQATTNANLRTYGLTECGKGS